jgi:predicted metalloendopeptidase
MSYYFNKKMLLTLPILIGFSEMQAQTKPAKTPGIDVTLMDKTVRPQDDFFQYVNGDWLDKTEIPSDRTRWGSFDELRQNTDKDALAILKEAAENPKYTSNTDQGKAVGLFETILDTVTRNKQGITPLKPYLAKINKVKSVKDLQALMIEMEPISG